MILVDGRADECVDARDRGLAYGDGVFRTVRTRARRPSWWADHVAKLAADCAALGLECPDAALLHQEVCSVAAPGEGVVKILVTRGGGARGYAPPSESRVTRVVLSAPLPAHAAVDAPQDVAARWCGLRLAAQPRLAGIKHLNRLENVLARAEWDDPQIVEGILRDQDGMLVGGVMSNLFWLRDGELFTPELSRCGVAGVARARLLRVAGRRGLRCHVGRWPAAAILAADEVMICNSVLGLRRVARIDDTVWPPAGWTATLSRDLDEDPV